MSNYSEIEAQNNHRDELEKRLDQGHSTHSQNKSQQQIQNFSQDNLQKTFVTGVQINHKQIKAEDAIPHYDEILDNKQKLDEIITVQLILQQPLKNQQVLDKKIANLLKQHENDFLFAFKDQMFQVQKELKNLQKKLDEETLKQKSDEKINVLQEERDWFRLEAIRLDKICKEQQKLINDTKFQNKILQEDKLYFENFIIETKKQNKQLRKELMTQQIEVENESSQKKTLFKTSSQNFFKSPPSRENRSSQGGKPTINTLPTLASPKDLKGNFLKIPLEYQEKDEYVASLLVQIERLKEIEQKQIVLIESLKNQIKKEKNSIKVKVVDKVKQITQKNELEELLLEAIEEVKKDIIKRRLALNNAKKERKPISSDEITLDKFSSTDKKKVIEILLNNEQILDQLHTIIFNNPQYQNIQNDDFMIKSRPNTSQKKLTRYIISQTGGFSQKALNQNFASNKIEAQLTQFTGKTKTLFNQIQSI